MFQQHVTPRHVRGAVKVTRKALNHALDVAEPKLESAAADLEDWTVDTYKSLRKSSLSKLDGLKGSYGSLEKRVRKQLPPVARKVSTSTYLLVAAGVTALLVGLLRRS